MVFAMRNNKHFRWIVIENSGGGSLKFRSGNVLKG